MGGDADEDENDEEEEDTTRPFSLTLLHDVRTLGDITVQACSIPQVMKRIPRKTFTTTLTTLRGAINLGKTTLIEVGDEEGNEHVALALAALESSVIALRLSVAAATLQQQQQKQQQQPGYELSEGSTTTAHELIIAEEVIESAIDATRFQLQHNVLTFHDARLRAATRPELVRGGGGGMAVDMNDNDDDDEHHNKGGGGGGGTSAAAAAAAAAAKKTPGFSSKKKTPTSHKSTTTTRTLVQQTPALASITDRVQAVLSLVSEFVPAIKVPVSMVIPILRSSVASITVPSLATMHVKSISLLAAVFHAYPDLRKPILDDLFTQALPYLGTTAKSLKREFTLCAGNGGGGAIQMFTAAVLLMVQGCAELPPEDASTSDIIASIAPAVKSADYFWAQCLDRLSTARAHKAETDQDFNAVLQGILADVLHAAIMPDWPASGTLLLRFASALSSPRGLHHPDAIVRQASVDLLGRLLTEVHEWEAKVRNGGEDAAWLEGIVAELTTPERGHAVQEILLKYLADKDHANSMNARIARQFMLARGLSEEALAVQNEGTLQHHGGVSKTKSEEGEVAKIKQLLIDSRKKSDELDVLVFDTGLRLTEATKLQRQMLASLFQRATPAMVSWLLEMLDPRVQAPTTRAKAVKALADLAAADPSVLNTSIVQSAVQRCLSDDSISVREAALSLLGRHMVGNPVLAEELFDTVIRAVDDPGASVRKSAIKILKDAAITVPGFPRAVDACCALLPRASDTEESVQNLVAKVFHSLWFSPSTLSAPSTSREGRASQLADVALAAYEAGGAAIHLPMDTQSPLVGVLRAAIGWEARGDLKVEWKTGRQIAEDLLDLILNNNQGGGGGGGPGEEEEEDEDAIRPALLALHALAVTDADFCVPERDPQKFLRILAPYLKASPDSTYPTEFDRRAAAERLLCVLNIVESALSQLDRLSDASGALNDVPGDLVNLINHHRYTQVVAASCKCLSALAVRLPAAAMRLLQVAQVYYSWLQAPGQHNPANLPRFLFILGQLCRYGADILERAAAAAPAGNGGAHPPGRPSLPACLLMFGQYWKYNGPPTLKEQIQRCALEATGQIAIARPITMVKAGSEAHSMMDASLRQDAPPGFKLAALGSLTELLQADAESLERRQREQLSSAVAKGDGGSVGGVKGGGSAKKKKSSAKKVNSNKMKKVVMMKKKKMAAAKSKRRRGSSKLSDEEEDEGTWDEDESEEESEDDGDEDALLVVSTVVATENGEGDSLSQSSAVLQQHWDSVLQLACDHGGGGDADGGVGIRRRVIALMEVVLRDGLVGPWTAVPSLVALCSDTATDISARALRLLSELSDKHPQYVDTGRITAGLEQAYKLHCGGGGDGSGSNAVPHTGRSGRNKHGSNSEAMAPASALTSIGLMYSALLWPSRPRRNEFLRGLLRHFRSSLAAGGAHSGSGSGGRRGGGVDLKLLAFVAATGASLPLKRAEEACILIQEANSMCLSYVDPVLVDIQSILGHGDEDEDDDVGRGGGYGANAAAKQKLTERDVKDLTNACCAGAALCMLHRLAQYVERAYGISHERAAAFAAAGKRKTAEEGTTVTAEANAKSLQLGDLVAVGSGSGKGIEAMAQAVVRELELIQEDRYGGGGGGGGGGVGNTMEDEED